MKMLFMLPGFLLCIGVKAQEKFSEKKIDLMLDSATIDQFITAVEKQTGVFFYYDKTVLDSFRFTVAVYQHPLEIVLQQVFDSTGINYFIDESGHVFLTSGFTIGVAPGILPPRPDVVVRKKINASPTSTRLTIEDNKIYDIGIRTELAGTGKATIAGYVRHYLTGEGVSGATLFPEGSKQGTVADKYGYYSLTLPKGSHVLKISSLGMADADRKIMLYNDGRLEIKMAPYVASLKEVTVTGARSGNVRGVLMGMQKVTIKTAKQLPALMGEADIIRVLQMLPGVTSASEGSTGLNVRGGSVDQNAVLFEGATIFNPSHFFGFFSGFNPDVIKDAELYKSSIPVRYGGRLSAVLEVVSREGNKKKLSASGGIGPLNGRLTLEGPIGKKTTFIAGGRSTYANWLLKILDDERLRNSRAGFYDVSLGLTHVADEKNTIYFTGYNSGDRFRLDADTLYRYGNLNGIVKWKHVFNNRFFCVVSGGYDGYRFSMERKNENPNDFSFSTAIQQVHSKLDLTYVPNAGHRIQGGVSVICFGLNPGEYKPLGKGISDPEKNPEETALESALYLGDEYTVSPNFSVNAGLRYALYTSVKQDEHYLYTPGVARELATITDTVSGSRKTWKGPEPRISLRYLITPGMSIKMAYNRTRQYIHLLSNTTVVSPTDFWKLSDNYIRPQTGDQYSIGLYRNFHENTIEVSAEYYYRKIRNALTYKNGATLFLNKHIETDVVNAAGKAYGLELLLRKTAGKLTGWFSYTWSRTLLKMDDPLIITPVNNGNYFPADYDKPHVANIVGNYRFSHRFSASLTSAYSTGRPITLPVARYYMNGAYRMFYAHRNSFRIPDYFRSDLSINIEGNHKVKKLAHSSWTVGVYNLTGRRNAYSVYFVSEEGRVEGYKLSIFGNAIPFATYNFKF